MQTKSALGTFCLKQIRNRKIMLPLRGKYANRIQSLRPRLVSDGCPIVDTVISALACSRRKNNAVDEKIRLFKVSIQPQLTRDPIRHSTAIDGTMVVRHWGAMRCLPCQRHCPFSALLRNVLCHHPLDVVGGEDDLPRRKISEIRGKTMPTWP